MTSAPTTYAPTAPPPALTDAVLCRWDAVFQGAHAMVPDGCVELMWVEHRGLIVCGPDTQPWGFEYAAPRRAGGIRLRPGRAAAVLGTDLGALRDQVVALADVLGDRRVRPWAERIEDGARPSAVLLDALAEPLATTSEALPVAALMAPGASLDDVTRDLGWSARRLHRVGRREFGYAPSVLRSILRVQRFLTLARKGPGRSLADLAVSAGFSDQPHLSRETVRWTGMTPRRLLASAVADWHGGATPVAA